jgi:hypothetical protein
MLSVCHLTLYKIGSCSRISMMLPTSARESLHHGTGCGASRRKGRARFCSGEVRVLDLMGAVTRIIPFSETDRRL